MLFGDADVEQSVLVALPERRQAGRARHRRGDGHDVAALGCIGDQRIGEHRRPARGRGFGRQPGLGVDDAAGVHQFGLVVLRGRVTHALAGDDVHDHRAVEFAGMPQCVLHRVFVVAVDRADVLQTQIGEHRLGLQSVLDTRLDAVHGLVADLADHRHTPHRNPAPLQELLVARLQSQAGQMIGEAADGRGVTAAVVVDDDDHRQFGGRDVVQRLPAHPAGQCAIPDDRHHVPVALAGQLERLGQPIRVRQRRRGVAGFHPVVVALGPRWIPRETALGAQGVEVGGAAGQHLVHIRLMAGVEDDRIVG